MAKLPAEEGSKPPVSSYDSFNSSPPIPTLRGQPDLDSDDDLKSTKPSTIKKSDSSVLKERDPNLPTTLTNSTTAGKSDTATVPKNKAFTCCIKGYAYKVNEDDPREADAGPGQRWQRMFGLFGTNII